MQKIFFLQQRRCFWLLLFAVLALSRPVVGQERSAKPTVAVVDITLQGGGHPESQLGVVLAKLLAEELVRQGRVQVVERALLEKILAEKQLAMAGLTAAHPLKAGELLGVDYILAASDLRFHGTSTLSGRLINAKTGGIVVSENIRYHHQDDLQTVTRNLAEMFSRNFSPAGSLQPKKRVNGSWESFASENSQSRFQAKAGAGGVWSYTIAEDDDDFAGVSFDFGKGGFKDTLLLTCRAKENYPVYIRFLSFVPGFSSEGDDESLVPVERLVSLGTIAVEVELSPAEMAVPAWWRKEKEAENVQFNRDDIRFLELAASEEVSTTAVSDEIEIVRIAGQ